ncbi:DUF262 domain-containing protein [Coraliomargarita algicola]|uniref:DUF262 domain-containing protein n=1 Tax=Coraliomargarita algicola TaxID=3092156 RepID=A0ABZ0RNA3_9BACT|nr:DUF262 domain-containing protein [Coraliomargarita sp. J2-16]WPJ96583.1 DUF262 domain-containing protein [Coraliomargarita sp. J2-16]
MSSDSPSTFESIFFKDKVAVKMSVPDYQRAFSWEEKQIELFVLDLSKNMNDSNGYYFGHFIAEDLGQHWEIVDGQQRITTFVLFLMVCQELSPEGSHASVYSLIDRFSTVSYDVEALKAIRANLGSFLKANQQFDGKNPPSDEFIIKGLSLQDTFIRSKSAFTRSQRRMVLALLQFTKAFINKKLNRDMISNYIDVIMKAHCSYHRTTDKSVAVNIFEMHNTRGMPLTTLEILKATLMKFVFDHGGVDSKADVEKIQSEFGAIYGMEEALATKSFRGEMTIEQLLRLHLRVVDDGTKKAADDFQYPPPNANSEALINYVNTKLRYSDRNNGHPRTSEEGTKYAHNLAKELRKSVHIMSERLPAWDHDGDLVGDVLILERELSCQFFLIICRSLASHPEGTDGKVEESTLLLWEKLLFTRDFHGKYYNLKGSRDNFPVLFTSLISGEKEVAEVIKGYLNEGFRSDRTSNLQSIVTTYIKEHKDRILNNAFYTWKSKMIYAIYKYEISKGSNIREVMKGTISVEHILPQDWQWAWIDGVEDPVNLSQDQKDSLLKEVGSYINGLGNLLLLTPNENTSVGNNHPADKTYKCDGGSYESHNSNREAWRSSENWKNLIDIRGDEIFNFMLQNLIGDSRAPEPSTTPSTTAMSIMPIKS